nr:solute carrier family 23 protein [Paenibacillus sp. DMB20]
MKTQADKQDPAQTKSQHLTVSPDEKISFGKSAILGLQHVVAMDVYVVPFLIAMLIGLQADQSSALIQSTFIAAGLATIVQSYFCMKLPVAQGPSYIPLGAIVTIYMASGGGQSGWSSVLGASLIGAVLVILLGFTGIFNKIVKSFIPPIVGGDDHLYRRSFAIAGCDQRQYLWRRRRSYQSERVLSPHFGRRAHCFRDPGFFCSVIKDRYSELCPCCSR